MENRSQNYVASPAIWDHTWRPTQVNTPRPNSSQTCR